MNQGVRMTLSGLGGCARSRVAGLVFSALALLGPAALHAHERAHQHGLVGLELSLAGSALDIAVDAPLDSLLGFERSPRNEQERAASAKVLADFADARNLFELPASARCVAARSEVVAPALQGKSVSGHADLSARYRWECAVPAQLVSFSHRLFQRYAGVSRIEVQGVTHVGQFKRSIKRPTADISLQHR
jgi:hypothetical protein